jgi:hypothetical protein
MTISVNHSTYVISIPKSDTTFVGTNATTGYEIRSYDEYALMRELADYLDSEAGQVLPSAFTHATQVTISGVVYARAISFLSPYTITFENGSYQVKLVGGSNNNMLDVLNPNSVSVIPANSAGLQTVNTAGGSGASAADVWAFATRTLTAAPAYNGPTVAQIWEYASRTLTATPGFNGPTAEQIAAAILAAAASTPIASDVKKVNTVTVKGTGQLGNEWGPE